MRRTNLKFFFDSFRNCCAVWFAFACFYPLGASCDTSRPKLAATGGRNEKTRVIEFPAQGLGQYFVSERPEFMVIWPDQPKGQPAKGAVRVLEKADITLSTGWGTGDNLPLLSHLRSDDIQSLDLVGSNVTHASFKYICRLKGLKKLSLAGTYIDDRDIAVLAAGLPKLSQLDLSDTPRITDRCIDSILTMNHLTDLNLARERQLTDAGFMRLAAMKSLNSLDLTETRLSDKGLSSITKIQTISALNLAHTKITDHGLQYLFGMPSLKLLDLSETGITDAGVQQVIGKLTMIEELNLSQTQVTDKGISNLAGLVNLRKIWLRSLSKVTEAAIPALSSHSKLQDIEIQKTLIMRSGVDALAKALPGCQVHSKSACKCRKRTRVN